MNQLKMSLKQSIISLAAASWSQRRIARELRIHRETVGKYLHEARASKPAIPPAGSEADESSKPAILPPGSAAGPVVVEANSVAGRKSQCEPWRDRIEEAVEAGLSAQRIYQDLVREEPFSSGYDSVKRFVRKLVQTADPPFRRIEVEAGAEAQVDFGQGAWVIQSDGRKRRPHLLRVVLSHSRKAYSEVVWRQTTEEFIRTLENAFRSFGGVPRTLVVDNLRAAVSCADWFDPDLNPKVREFCSHYGTVMLPCRPAMPRHKGKVEAGVKYVIREMKKQACFQDVHKHSGPPCVSMFIIWIPWDHVGKVVKSAVE